MGTTILMLQKVVLMLIPIYNPKELIQAISLYPPQLLNQSQSPQKQAVLPVAQLLEAEIFPILVFTMTDGSNTYISPMVLKNPKHSIRILDMHLKQEPNLMDPKKIKTESVIEFPHKTAFS